MAKKPWWRRVGEFLGIIEPKTSKKSTPAPVPSRHTGEHEHKLIKGYDANTFETLDEALRFAGGLPARKVVYLSVYGQLRRPEKYDVQRDGWVSLSGLARPNKFRSPGQMDKMRQLDRNLITQAELYQVRHRWEQS